MATRFGASKPAQAYQSKVKLLVFFLIAVILILVFLVFFVFQKGDKGGKAAPVTSNNQAGTQQTDLNPNVKILYASRRIEEGDKLTEAFFREQEVPTDRMPEGALKAANKLEVVGKYSTSYIAANTPILQDSLSEIPPIGNMVIPPGYRALTISINSTTGVGFHVRPKDRVDVLLTYSDPRTREKRVVTVVGQVLVLAVGGRTGGGKEEKATPKKGGTTTSLLLKEYDAKRVELSRSLGKISLTLVGRDVDIDPDNLAAADVSKAGGGYADSQQVTAESIIGSKRPTVGDEEQEPADGKIIYRDPQTGQMKEMVLDKRGNWKAPK